MIPTLVIHFQPITWRMPVVRACRAAAMAVTDDYARVTCPVCQAGLEPLLRAAERPIPWREALERAAVSAEPWRSHV